MAYRRCDEVFKSVCDLNAYHAGPHVKYQFIPHEPTSPSVETYDEHYLISQCRAAAKKIRELEKELICRNQDIADLQLTNRNLSRKIVEDARKRGEAASQQPNWPRGIHGS